MTLYLQWQARLSQQLAALLLGAQPLVFNTSMVIWLIVSMQTDSQCLGW